MHSPVNTLIGIFSLLLGVLLFSSSLSLEMESVIFVEVDCQDPAVPPSPPLPNQLWAGSDKTMYAVNENMTFSIYSNVSGNVTYSIREDRFAPELVNGVVTVTAGSPTVVNYHLDHPGFILFKVTQNYQSYTTGVGVDACDIATVDTVMTNFDSFWNGLKTQLAAVPVNPQLTYRSDKSDGSQQTYKMELDNIDGKKVHGWVSIPNCPNPQPAILKLPAFGTQPIGPYPWVAKKGAIVVSISIHDYDPELWVPDNIAYQPPCYFEDENINYYKWAIIGALRVIDFIFTLPQFNGTDIGVSGKSQGGGLAVIVAGLDARVTALAQSQAALSDHEGLLNDRSSGFPYWIRDSACSAYTLEQIRAAMSYYSAPTFAARYSGPSLNAAGYIDEICPPSTVFSFYNQFTGQKTMIHGVDKGHNGVNPEYDPAEQQFFIDRFGMIDYPACLALLPLDLLSFKGRSGPAGNTLDWLTENEENTAYFRIERSADAISFDSIGEVKAVNRKEVNAYFYYDEAPVNKAYYRLKMVDQDGTFSYSKLVFLEREAPPHLVVYPNPFIGQVTLQSSARIEEASELLFFNAFGQLVKTVFWGREHYLTVSFSDLPAGVYTYQLINGQRQQFIGKILHQQ